MTAPKKINALPLAILLAAALTGTFAVSALAQPAPPPARVATATVAEEMLSPEIQVSGTVISRNDSRISSEVSGRLVWVAEVGERAEEGDAIARIDARLFRLALVQAEAGVKRLEADLAFRNKDVGRIEELAATKNTPISRLEQSVSQRDMVAQDLVEARGAMQRAGQDLERTAVRAPFPGRVVERLAQAGEYASVGSELVRLVDTDHVEVRAQAPIAAAAYLRDGLPVRVTGGDAEEIATPIRAVIPVGDEVSRMMELRIALPAGRLVIGSAVKVALPSAAPRRAVVVPRDALILRANSTYVYRVNGDQQAEKVEVRTGLASGDLIEVIGSLGAGDKVVVRGGERLREGQVVALAD